MTSATSMRALRRALGMALLVLVASLVWTGWALLDVRDDVEAARTALTTATDGDRGAEHTTAELERAVDRLDLVERRLSAPGPALVGALPLVGRTPRAVRVSSQAVQATVEAARRVIAVTDGPRPLLQDGRIDLPTLARLSTALRQAQSDLAGPAAQLRDLETAWTPSPVGRAVDQVRQRVDPAPRGLGQAAAAVDALGGLVGGAGPRRALVLLQNNAELRGAGGLVAVFAEAVGRDGRLELGAFRDVEAVADDRDAARQVLAPQDYRQLWGQFKADTTLWKNTNMTPDLETASAVMAGVAAGTLNRRPDAMIWLDVRALAAVIGATSPARLPDGTLLTEASTVPALLSDAYRTGDGSFSDGQAQRRARLRGAADAVAQRLLGGDASVFRLARALKTSADGRHVAVWSARPQEQSAWEAAEIAGVLEARDGDLANVAVQNLGGGQGQGNKLDYYSRRLLTVRVRVDREEAVVEQELALRNTAPRSGLPPYVAGLDDPGTTNNYLTFAVPGGARITEFSRGGSPVPTSVLPQGDHKVLTDVASLAPGTTATWRLAYRLPLQGKRYRLTLVPQALAVDAGLSVTVTAGPGVTLSGSEVTDGRLEQSGPWTSVERVDARARHPSRWSRALDRVRRFWNEPVRLP